MRSCSAGAASASNNPPASTAESSGRRRTRSTIAPQTRPSPLSGRIRPTSGTCRRSTRSPSLERGVLAPPRGTLLTLAAQVEQRVVDADREPDQQYDSERFLREGEQVTGK